MTTKFMQAAVITFFLYLLMGAYGKQSAQIAPRTVMQGPPPTDLLPNL